MPRRWRCLTPMELLTSNRLVPEQNFAQFFASGGPAIGPELIWGIDFVDHAITPVRDCDSPLSGAFRWLHLNLAGHGTRQWLEETAAFPDEIREMFLSPETHQRAVVEGGNVGCVLHDFERDFDVRDTEKIGALRLAITPGLVVTARHHPLRCADIVRSKLERGTGLSSADEAFDLLIHVLAENLSAISRGLSAQVLQLEESFLDGRAPPAPRDLIHIRRRLSQIYRVLSGARSVLQRLEIDEELPDMLVQPVEKWVQRMQAMTMDATATLTQLRQLREEIDMQEAQRTNQNLYILSIVTALMLPATLVTGIFGMNTGGMPFAGTGHGTLIATGAAMSAAAATYCVLRRMGFMRR